MNEPKIIHAGDTVEWTESLSNYPATSYTLKYYFRGATQLDVTATATADDYAITIPAASTELLSTGNYYWVSVVTDGDGNRYTVSNGTVQVKPNYETITSVYDGGTHAQKVLDAIEALLEGREDVSSLSIDGKAITKMPIMELIKWRDYYRNEVSQEEKARLIAQGLSTNNNVRIRFV